MGIFSILARNSARGSRTRSPDERVPYPAGFRGMVAHDSVRCTGCGSCAYVCAPAAITLGEATGRAVEWTYVAGRCTFCGRCAEYCPTRCLTLEETMPPVASDPSAHRVAHQVFYQPCARCGRPVIPLPLQTLRAMYGDPVPADLVERRRLCERCRGRSAAERLKDWPGGGARG